MSDFVPAQHLARDGDRINLAVLQRIDIHVEKILFSAGHTALYGYNTQTRQWASKDVEGSTFLVQRTFAPFYQLLVLNKKSANNFKEAIDVDAFQFEVSGPYIMYENAQREVGGMWLYDTKLIPPMVATLEGMKNAHLAMRAQQQAQALSSSSRQPGPAPEAPAPASRGAEAAFWEMLGQAPQSSQAAPQLLAAPPPAAAGPTPAPSAASDNMARLFGSASRAPSAPLASSQPQQAPQNPPRSPQGAPSAQQGPTNPLVNLLSPQKPPAAQAADPFLAQAGHGPHASTSALSPGASQARQDLNGAPPGPGSQAEGAAPSSRPPMQLLMEEEAAPQLPSASSAALALAQAVPSPVPRPAAPVPVSTGADLLTPSFFRQPASASGIASSPPKESLPMPVTTGRAASLGQQEVGLNRIFPSAAAGPAASHAAPPAASQAAAASIGQQQRPRSEGPDGLTNLIARAKGLFPTALTNGGPPAAAVKPGEASRPPDGLSGAQPSPDPGEQERPAPGGSHAAVRAAMHALADSDDFISLIVSKLGPALRS